MIVTIDGPAGAGKSSVAKALARRLGFRFLDTGAMYRAVVLAAIRGRANWEDEAALAQLAQGLALELTDDAVFLNGQDVSGEIRLPEIAAQIHYVADNAAVRRHLVECQRRIVGERDYVTEGRDQGTVAFPHAECKIFLTATPEERAKRRLRELTERGEPAELADVLAAQNARDRRDATRPVGRLVRAEDAELVLTDGLTQDEVVDLLERLVRKRQQARS
jgi:cytidylate kinase